MRASGLMAGEPQQVSEGRSLLMPQELGSKTPRAGTLPSCFLASERAERGLTLDLEASGQWCQLPLEAASLAGAVLMGTGTGLPSC